MCICLPWRIFIIQVNYISFNRHIAEMWTIFQLIIEQNVTLRLYKLQYVHKQYKNE